MAKKHTSASVYLLVWFSLCALTALSFLLSLANLGEAETAAALVIAVAKSALVGLFFMHLVEERFRIAIVPLVTTGFIVILVSVVVTDVVTRRTFPRTPVPVTTPEGLDPAIGPGPSR